MGMCSAILTRPEIVFADPDDPRGQITSETTMESQCGFVEGKALIGNNFLVTDCTRQATSAAETAAANVLQGSETAFNKV